MTKKIIVITLILLGALLIFTRLDNSFLWEDEAETAAISKNMLVTFWPSVKSNGTIVTQESGHDSNSSGLWTLQTWLPHFTTALSFKLLGVNTWNARLPYAAAGLLALIAAFYFTYRQKNNFTQAAGTLFFLTFSLLFILHIRQCRYYALSILFSILWTFSFWRSATDKKQFWLAALSGIMLFHAQYFIAVALFGATLISKGPFEKDRRLFIKNSAKLFGVIALFTVPWIAYVRLWEKIGANSASGVFSYALNLMINLININHFIFPLFILVFLFFYRKTLDAFDKYLLVSGIAYTIIISACPLFPDIRYLIILVFWGAYIYGMTLKNSLPKNKIFSIILALSIVLSNFWSLPYWLLFKPYLPEKLSNYYGDLRFDLPKYFYELTHENSGPVKAAVKYLNRSAKPGDSIFLSYEAEPFIFYTNLKIIRELPFHEKPEWIILRGDQKTWQRWLKWVLLKDNLNPPLTGKYVWNFNIKKEPERYWEKRKIYLENYIAKNKYKKIILPVENTFWENRPNLLWHRFGMEKVENPLVIYSLKK